MDLTAIQSILISSLIFKSPHFQQVNRKLKDLDTKRSVDADEELMMVQLLYIRTHPIQQVFEKYKAYLENSGHPLAFSVEKL